MKSGLKITIQILFLFPLMSVTTGAFATNTEGHWRFEQNSGPIIDSYPRRGTVDETNGRKNNGFVGTWAGAWDANENPLSRNGTRVTFDASSQDHIIMIDDAEFQDFNANMSTFIWKAKVKIDSSGLNDSGRLNSSVTWNVMQKGRYNKNGMWKMQILPFKPSSNTYFTQAQQLEIANSNWDLQAEAGDPVLMCQVQDDNNNTFNAMSRVKLKPGVIYYPRCVIDRTANQLKAQVRYNNAKNNIEPPEESVVVNKVPLEKEADNGGLIQLGLVNPGTNSSFTCAAGKPAEFQGHNLLDFVSIGHRPVCPNFTQKWQAIIDDPASTSEEVAQAAQKLDELFDDGFKGKIYQVKVEKPTNF